MNIYGDQTFKDVKLQKKDTWDDLGYRAEVFQFFIIFLVELVVSNTKWILEIRKNTKFKA